MTTVHNRRGIKERLARATTLGLLALAAVLYPAAEARAQWATSGNNISNTNTGNVGVGTSTPAQIFHVHSIGTWAGTRVTTAATGGTINDGVHFGYDDAYGAYVWNRENSPIIFSTNNTERMRIDSAGTVLINNPAAGQKLAVTGGADTSLAIGDRGMGGSVGLQFLGTGYKHGAIRFDGDSLVVENASNTVLPSTWYNGQSMNLLVRNGSVGIGTAAPGARLDVGAGAAARGNYSDVLIGAGGNNSQLEFYGPTKSSAITHDESMGGMVFYTNGPAWTPSILVGSTGNVGIGTTAPLHKLDVSGNMTVGSGYASSVTVPVNGLIVEGGVGIGTPSPSAQYKLDVAGDVRVSGNISAKYQDVAEWVPSTQKLAAGTVVILDPERSNQVLASASAYDTSVAGVVSAQPGITLGEGGEGKVMVATTGRVKVKVDATRAPVKVGDLLVTGDTPGVAMRSQPLDVGGAKIHRPGTIIGKALEPLAGGTAEILVLLSLQ